MAISGLVLSRERGKAVPSSKDIYIYIYVCVYIYIYGGPWFPHSLPRTRRSGWKPKLYSRPKDEGSGSFGKVVAQSPDLEACVRPNFLNRSFAVEHLYGKATGFNVEGGIQKTHKLEHRGQALRACNTELLKEHKGLGLGVFCPKWIGGSLLLRVKGLLWALLGTVFSSCPHSKFSRTSSRKNPTSLDPSATTAKPSGFQTIIDNYVPNRRVNYSALSRATLNPKP